MAPLHLLLVHIQDTIVKYLTGEAVTLGNQGHLVLPNKKKRMFVCL